MHLPTLETRIPVAGLTARVPRPRTYYIIEAILVFVAALGFSVYFLYPLSLNMGAHLHELGDSRLNAYIQAWDTHALLHHPLRLFDTNMYYPSRYTLAGSENLLGTQLLFAPAYLLTGNPAFACNLVILGSFLLCAVTMYLLMRCITGDPFAAAIAGFVYGFALPRVAQLSHMQLLSMQWIPLIILCLYGYLTTKRNSRLVGAAGFLLLQILCSLYLGYMAITVTACFLLAIAATRRDLLTRAVVWRLACAGLAVALCLVPIVRPYLHLQKHGAISPAAQRASTIGASANPIGSYLDVAGFPGHVYENLLHGNDSHELGWEKRLFMGFLPMGLALAGLFSLKWRDHSQSVPGSGSGEAVSELYRPFLIGCLLTLAVAYVLSLGPYLRVYDQATHIRLPFAFFRRYVPGMGVFRVPARFGFMVMFAVAALAGVGFKRLASALTDGKARYGRRVKAALLLVAILVMTIEFRGTPVGMERVMAPPHIAPEYLWLARQPAGSVTLELPITSPVPGWPDPFEQAGYLYASAYHWQPTINGYTGYKSPAADERYRLAAQLPKSADAVRQLAGIGLRYIVVHTDKMPSAELAQWQSLAPDSSLQPVCRFDDGAVIYQVSLRSSN